MTDQATVQTECLSADTIRSYWEGMVPDLEMETIEQHLQNCQQCMALFRRFETAREELDILRDFSPENFQAVSPNPERAAETQQNREQSLIPQDKNRSNDGVSGCYPWQSWLPQSKQIGPYKILSLIGQGGMGAVVLAEHVRLHRRFAIKLLYLPRSLSHAQSRFQREAEAVGRLRHPSIVTASDAGQEGPLHYLVMEYVEGFDLSKLNRLIGEISIYDVSEIGRQIALALSYAHAQGLVHRDIKPSNIMLDNEGRIKLLDFGLVQIDRWDDELSELTSVGQFLGTLDYMAPEQAERSGQVDHRADLYALGATLFRLLCGRAPLASTPNLSPLEKLRLLAHHAPPSLRTLRRDAPAALVKIIDSLLSTDPNDRPPSAAHVAEALEPFVAQADLKRLIEQGNAAQATLKPRDEALISQQELVASDQDDPPTPREPADTLPPPSRWRRYGSLVALALLPLAFIAGILIQIPVEEGMLIIESELPESELKIVRSKDGHEQQLKLDIGPQVTKLRAGKYSLELNSPSDSIAIENDTFVVSKGETVVAKVRLKRSESPETREIGGTRETPTIVDTKEPVPANSIAASSPATGPTLEARYQGKNLSEWLEIYEQQKNGRLPAETFQALVVLLGHSAEQALFEEVFAKLFWSREMEIGFRVPLSSWHDPRIVDSVFKQFEQMDRAAKHSFLSSTRKSTRRFNSEQLSRVLEWIEDQHASGAKDASEWFDSLTGLRANVKEPVGKSNQSDLGSVYKPDFDWLSELEKINPELFHRYDTYVIENALWNRLTRGSQGRISSGGFPYEQPNEHLYQVRAAERVLNSKNANSEQRIIAIRLLMDNQSKLSSALTQQSLFDEYRKQLKSVPADFMQRFHWGTDSREWDSMKVVGLQQSICGIGWTLTPSLTLLGVPQDNLVREFHAELLELALAMRELSGEGLKRYESISPKISPNNLLAGINRTYGNGATVVLETVASYPPEKQEDVKQMLTQTQALILQLRLFEILVNSPNLDPKTIVRDFKRYLESLEEWRELIRQVNKESDGIIANSDLKDKTEAVSMLQAKGFTIPLDQPINLPIYLETKYRDQ
ncbi:serine/threonine protein kinase [Pirellulaceae bacterium SH449]